MPPNTITRRLSTTHITRVASIVWFRHLRLRVAMLWGGATGKVSPIITLVIILRAAGIETASTTVIIVDIIVTLRNL